MSNFGSTKKSTKAQSSIVKAKTPASAGVTRSSEKNLGAGALAVVSAVLLTGATLASTLTHVYLLTVVENGAPT